MSKKKILKSIISIMIATFMVFAAVVPQQMEAYAADSEFKVELGLAKPTSGNTFSNGTVFKYENATISSANNKQVNTLTISVDKGGINTTSISNASKSYSDYVEGGAKHKMCVWIFDNADVTTVQNALRSIEFTYAEGMMVTVVIDGNANSIPDNAEITFTSYDMGSTNINDQLHYYMYVPYASSSDDDRSDESKQTWSNAYDKAKTTTFLGMKGYLATITMLGEDQVLDNLSKDGAWAGGARLYTDSVEGKLDTDTWTIEGPKKTTTNTAWYWVCGPEAGKNIPTTWNAASKNKESTDKGKGVLAYDVSDTCTTGYSNWRRSGGTSNEPNNYTDSNSTGEWCLQVHYDETSVTSQQGSNSPKGWNDYSNEVNKEGYGTKIKGYYIEFSEYANSTPSNYNSTLKYTVKDPVNHTHEWTYTADDNADTITATCGKCTQKPEIKLTTTDAEYTGSEYTGVTITGADSFTNMTGATVTTTYVGRDGTTYDSSTPPTDAGEYAVKVTVTSGTDTYTVSKNFTITPKEVSVTVNNQEVNIGNDISSTTSDITVDGLVGGDTLDSVSLVIGDGTGSTTKVTSSTQNNSDISVKNDNGIVIKNGTAVKTGNYTFNITKGKLTAKKNPLTVTTPPTVSAITYGDTVGSSTITGGVVKDGETPVEGTWSWKSEGANDKPGVDKSNSESHKWTLVFTPTDSDKYDPIEYATKLTINPKEVSVIWSNDTYTYDGTDHIPTATVNTADLVGSDTCGVTVAVTKGTTAEDHPKYAGNYTAKATSTNSNYVIKTPDNSKDYSIAKKNITLKAPSDSVAKDSQSTNMTKDKITIDPALVTGDSLTAATITHTEGDDDYKTVGEHEISIDVSSVMIMNGSVDVTGSYNISVTNGKLTVGTKAPSDAQNHKPAVTITYGDKLGDPDVIAQLVSTNGPVMDNGTEVKGHWKWDTDEDPDVNTTMPHVDDTNKPYPVKFVPVDTTNYSVYKTTVTITVNPKPIDVTWNKDSFVYNGKEQIPTPTAKAGDLVGSDTVTFTVTGKKINVGDDYSATITAINNPNYVVKDSSKLKKFKITPTSIDPEVNTKIKITVTYDSNDDPVVHIYDEEAQKELTNGTDFEVNYTSDPNNEYNDVKITGKGNYSGNTTKLVKNIRYQGVIRSIVDLDPSSAEYAPKMNAVPDDKALDLVEAKISSNTTDASGKTLTDAQKNIAIAIMEDYKDPTLNHTSDKGELKADVILTMKELNDAELAKLNDSDPTQRARKERIETDMQLVQTVMAMPEHKSELEGMTVGGYLDLNLYVRYSITPADSSITPYSTPNIQLYDNLGFEQEVTITIPQKMLPAAGHSRTYTVVRIHYPEGDTTKTPEKDVLPTTRNGNELTFTTGMFSTYAILYRDTLDPVPPKPTPDPDPEPSGDTPAKPPKTPTNIVAPKTADTVDVFVAWGMVSMGVITLLGCIYANRKVNKKYKRGL